MFLFVAGRSVQREEEGLTMTKREGYSTCEPWVDSSDADVVCCYHFVYCAHHT